MCGWSLEFSIDVEHDRRLVRARIYGIWKGAHADSYHHEFEEKAQGLFDKPWAKLVDLTAWKTSYPDTVQRIAAHMQWCHEHNNVLSIYVVNNPSTFRMLKEMITRGGTSQAAQVVKTIAEADEYLAKHWQPEP